MSGDREPLHEFHRACCILDRDLLTFVEKADLLEPELPDIALDRTALSWLHVIQIDGYIRTAELEQFQV